MAAASGALVLATGACSDSRPFERESAGAQTRLAVPTSMTPLLSVREVDGAPPEWKLSERIAAAMHSRDIAASFATRSRSAYVLKGEMRQGVERNGRRRVEIIWNLYDGVGRKVGKVTQMAAVPGAAFQVPNEGVVEAMADAAAKSIAPLVLSSSVQLADGTETGERKGNERAKREDRDRVTAVGRYEGAGALSRNLFRSDNDPAKPLPPPQRVAQQAPRQTAEAEESLGAAPKPATDGGRRMDVPARVAAPQRAEAEAPRPDVGPSSERPRQVAEGSVPRRGAPPPPRTEQYAERTPPRAGLQYWVQIGAHKDEATSRAEWQKLQNATVNLFANIGNRIQRADLGKRGIYYRIQLGPFASSGEAGRFCAELKTRQIDCFLAPPEAATAANPAQEAPRKAAPPAPAPKPVAKPAEAKPAEPLPPPPEQTPPPNASAEKPDAPLSTAPGLPGVLD